MLSPEKRTQLDGIVATMAKQNASQGEVQAIVNDFKAKYDVIEQPKPTEQTELGLGGKLLERGKNIVEEFKPKKETSTYEKVSNALGGKTLRVAGQVAGAIGDVAGTVIGEGAKKIYETAYTQEQREKIKKNVVNVLETPIGQAGLNAIKSGIDVYSEWKKNNPNVAKDLEAVVNVASILPVGKVAGVVGKAAAKATIGARKSVAKTILGSAEKNVAEALAPATKKTKALTEKITPEFIKRGIVGSRETILKKAEEGASEFGEQIKSYLKSDKLVGEVPKNKVISVIDNFAKSGMSKSGVVIDTEKVGLAEKMRGIISQFGDNIPADEAKSVIQIIGGMVERKGGFTATGIEKLSAKLEKNIYGTIAGELAKSNPNLDRLNKAFHFYDNLRKVTQETITRTKPQSGMFKKAAAVLFAGQGQGVFDTVIKYIGSKLFLDFVSGPFYKTVSAKVKKGLAKAIYSGDVPKANNIIENVKKEFLALPAPSYIPMGQGKTFKLYSQEEAKKILGKSVEKVASLTPNNLVEIINNEKISLSKKSVIYSYLKGKFPEVADEAEKILGVSIKDILNRKLLPYPKGIITPWTKGTPGPNYNIEGVTNRVQTILDKPKNPLIQEARWNLI